MNVRLLWFVLVVTLHWSQLAAWSQQACPAINIPQPAPGTNIFNAQQEAALGDAIDAGLRQTMHIVQDSSLIQPLNAIGSRLAAQLPSDHPPFKIVLFDSASADAFSIPGHIYVSRKLIVLTRNEDEMAGILAHEMGHLMAHHSAIQASESLHRVLSVTQVGDSADVIAKWNQFLSNYKRVKLSESDVARAEKRERQQQEQADSIGLSVVARAGYSTQAFVEVFDRIAETNGKTGNAWTDFFGSTPPDSKRLRQLEKDRPPLPHDCVMAHGDTIPNYVAWRSKVMEQHSDTGTENLPGLLSKRELTERLRPLVSHIRISPDGKYVLAQDDSNIYVLTRAPLKNVFRIDAPDASPAQFTPDVTGIVFHVAGMGSSPRVERWDIASQTRVEIHEIYVRRGCLVSELSPDGKNLACLTYASGEDGANFDFDLYDTGTGNSYFHKKDWVALNATRLDYSILVSIMVELTVGVRGVFEKFMRVAISPDGRYLVAHSPENVLAMDLTTRTPVSLPGSIKDLLAYGRFTFLSDGHFMGVGGNRGDQSSVVEFPSGRPIEPDILVGAAKLRRAAHGDYVLLSPIKDSPLGVLDLKTKAIIFESKREAFDLWDSQGIAERENGDLVHVDLKTAKIGESITLPEARLGAVSTATVSPDLSWLALSQSSRGAVWNMQSGQRLYHLRGFRGGYFTAEGAMYADFPQYLKTDRSIVRLSLTQQELRAIHTLGEKEYALQAGKYLLTLVPGDDKNGINHNVTFELHDVTTMNLLWSKHFAQERPGYVVDSATNSLMLHWQAASKEVQRRIKEDPEASAKLAPFKNKEGIDYIEIFDLDSGNLRFKMAVDTGKNSISVADMSAAADRLVLADNKNRLLVYGIDGQLKGTVLGVRPTISPSAKLMTARTQSGELTLYDLQTLQARAVYNFDSRIAFSGFSADGKRLLVMTANQAVYMLDTTAKADAVATATT